jgi:hypothetical protein
MSACVNARSVCVRTFPRAPLCGAEFGILNLDDGDVSRIAAVYNVPPALPAAQNVPFRIHPKSGQAEICRTKPAQRV